MGKQVPDISPEGLAELTRVYRESVDRESVRSFFEDKTVDESVLIRWRESAGISKAGTARLLGMSKMGYSRIENGDYPITDHFLGSIRKLLNKLDTTGFDFHPSDRSKSAPRYYESKSDYIPRKNINTDLRHIKCFNPECSNWFYSASRNQKYCSRRCKNYVSTHHKIDGILTKTPRDRREYIPLWVKCPSCQNEFPAKGHITSGSNRYPRLDNRYRTNGQADHDGQKQVHQEVGGVLSDGLLPDDKSSFQSDE